MGKKRGRGKRKRKRKRRRRRREKEGRKKGAELGGARPIGYCPLPAGSG